MSVSNRKATTKTLKDETWATLKEIAESQKKADRRKKKFDRRIEKSREKFREDLKKSKEEFDLSMKKSREEFDRRIEKINGTLGSWSHNIGDFAEDYFINSFEQGKKIS